MRMHHVATRPVNSIVRFQTLVGAAIAVAVQTCILSNIVAVEFAYPVGEAGELLRQQLSTVSVKALPPLAPPSTPRAARRERDVPLPQAPLPMIELPPARSHMMPSEKTGAVLIRPLEDQPPVATMPGLRPARPKLPLAPLLSLAGPDAAAPPPLAPLGVARSFPADPTEDATATPLLNWLLAPLGPIRATPAVLANEPIPDPDAPQRALPRRPLQPEIDPTPQNNQPLPARVFP